MSEVFVQHYFVPPNEINLVHDYFIGYRQCSFFFTHNITNCGFKNQISFLGRQIYALSMLSSQRKKLIKRLGSLGFKTLLESCSHIKKVRNANSYFTFTKYSINSRKLLPQNSNGSVSKFDINPNA
jgi:hypothetical protein